MSMLLSGQHSWLRYFTDLSSGYMGQPDGNSKRDLSDGELDFDTALQKTIAEYGATKDHLEMLEKKLSKMVEIKEAKARSDYEVAKRNLEISEKEAALVRRIVSTGSSTEDDTDTIKGDKKGDARPMSPGDPLTRPLRGEAYHTSPNHRLTYGNADNDKALPDTTAEERLHALVDELEQTKLQLAEQEQARMVVENTLASEETQTKLDLAHARITLKNEQAARAKADALVAEEAKSRYAAEQEIQRLRTELKLVGMDAKVQRGGIPFAASQAEKRDQWLESRSPEELQELQGAISRALEGGDRRRTLDGLKKRKLSKSHRFRSQSTDVIANDAIGNTANILAGEAL